MKSSLADRLARSAERRRNEDRQRAPSIRGGISFASNDYLGLSRHPVVAAALREAIDRGVAHGATGSRLLSGTAPEHQQAEERFAAFVARERAILFGSGYAANLGVITALTERRDLIVLDSLAHASLREGARASHATRRMFAHNDTADLERALRDRERFDQAFVVVEGIYSMDGDSAPIEDIDAIATAYDAHLIVDEAHSTGLYGEAGRGVHSVVASGRLPLATVHPCGKALGGAGAFVAADAAVIDALVNGARPFIFSTAPSPLQAVGLTRAIELLPALGDRVEHVFAMAARLRASLDSLERWRLVDAVGPIVALVVGSARDAVEVQERLWSRGLDVRAVRPPTVAEGTARLRITIVAERSVEDIDRLTEALTSIEKELSDTSQ